MHWPQITVIICYVLSFLTVLAKHGEPKNENYDIGLTTASTLIMATLLFFGGFWT